MYTPDCNLQPQMPIYMMSGKELFPSHEMECNLTRNQGVRNIREGDVHKVKDTNLARVCLRGKLSLLEVLHQESKVERLRATKISTELEVTMLFCIQSVPVVGSVLRYQPGVIDYKVAPQRIDITNVAVLDPG